ncbi:MAG TPA: NAD(P)H-dependent oxidoreductase subunit E [Pseudomonadota bacterium]|nr:NAD(P)H-dependent oxidoreductase subunit E [Pseudomonadota bacterium]
MSMSSPSEDLRAQIKAIVASCKGDPTELLTILREVQRLWRRIPAEAITAVAEELDIPRVHVEGTATFYHFFTEQHAGDYTIYVNTSVTAEMAGAAAVIAALESELGVKLGSNTADDRIGLRKTSCIGMCDQEPAILINDTVFTAVTPERVRELVAGMRAGVPLAALVRPSLDGNNALPSIGSEVRNHLRRPGPVIFAPYAAGDALRRAMELGSVEVVEQVKAAGLRGRGGAGFPTGQKWSLCRAAPADGRYVICNVDEGEPGTFKDRVLMTERAEMVFEAMTIAGYAVEAREGILYLRGEYAYLRPHLEQTLEALRARRLLGRKILGTRFSFDIRIKQGAGAYICGEESALIESAEGKRGQPRNRPPFPVTAGYLHKPTIVNNPETLCCALQIVRNGPEWFRRLGTPASAGVKLLSIAGDCDEPGVYEVEWGLSVQEVLNMCKAREAFAVQVGGPSGVCISQGQFHRKLCYEDLPTGGAFTIFGKGRDLLSIVHNQMEFFRDESCGFCVPCRAGNALLVKSLEKIMVGSGTAAELVAIRQLGRLVKTTSRCGLGQTAPNPLLSTIENFADYYAGKVRQDVDFVSQFSLEHAVADACAAAHRSPNLREE